MAHDITHVLGKNTTEYKEHYAPDYLAREERQNNRNLYNIDGSNLPFRGVDIWHGYEASFLVNGVPINGIVKIAIPCNTRYIVESKSLKLYLFSYAMENLKGTVEEGIRIYENRVRRDLSSLLESDNIAVSFHQHIIGAETEALQLVYDKILESSTVRRAHHVNLDQRIGFACNYSEDPSILKTSTKTVSMAADSFFAYSAMLKSNCKITHQADYGEVYVYMEKPKYLPDFDSISRYIVSFRQENHFHEEIVECLFTRLNDAFKPTVLDIMAFYTRRGGIDICPMRSTRDHSIFESFKDMSTVNYRAMRS